MKNIYDSFGLTIYFHVPKMILIYFKCYILQSNKKHNGPEVNDKKYI